MFFSIWRRRMKQNARSDKGRHPKRASLHIEPLEDRLLPSIFTVTNTNDSGPGSLRDAILRVDADANPGLDTINFAIGSGDQTIAPTSPLPAVTHPVIIDGTSQPGFAGSPLIELDGANAGTIASGLTISAGISTVKALVINRFGQDGILLQGKGSDTLQGNFIGTNATGSQALGNGANGVEINGIGNNIIGGTASGNGNLISGNALDGIFISGSAAKSNQVQGNFIGTDRSGTFALGNGVARVMGHGSGVDIEGAPGNAIGGTMPHAHNLISGNGQTGVLINGAGARLNLVQGNFIGTDITGTFVLGNGASRIFVLGSGVYIKNASDNIIGGTTAGAHNLISGNLQAGVFIFADVGQATGNLVQGNFIGTDVTGVAALGNGGGGYLGQGNGVDIQGAADNTIGGTTAAARNLISGNQGSGVFIFSFNGPVATRNVVEGNFIGTDVSGTSALGNGSFLSGLGSGVEIEDSSANVIGGTISAARNVIAANGIDGIFIHIFIARIQPSGNRVQGNYIGTDVTGSAALANQRHGIEIVNGLHNIIGGIDPGARNVISGNRAEGVQITGLGDGIAAGNRVQGNYIGTDITGTAALGNGGVGVDIAEGSGNSIGGTSPQARNLISSNGLMGIEILTFGMLAQLNLVQGNYIGTDVTGTMALGNGNYGVYISGASHNIVGGTALGTRNLISGNLADGVSIDGGHANFVQGNYIGTDVSGSVGLGNRRDGVSMFDPATNNVIGGTTFSARNIISGNAGNGVSISFGGSLNMHNLVEGNYIGTDVSGTLALGNAANGIKILGGADSNTIGGTTAGAGNLISGNGQDGVLITDGASANRVVGNMIGTDGSGSIAMGNRHDGVDISGGSNNQIGGLAIGAGNLISGNVADGIFMGIDPFGNGATGNLVEGNLIGTDISGTRPVGNGAGVFVADAGNIIGGTSSAAGNLISGNAGDGITLAAMNNLVQGNFIGTDLSGRADLGNGGNGISITGANNTVGGLTAGARNLISGNSQDGVALNGSSAVGNLVEGNFIGTDVFGSQPLQNFRVGVSIFNGAAATIGGVKPEARNVVSGNAVAGIYIQAISSSLIEGNFIGTDRTGTLALANNGYGVAIFDSSGVMIGGTAAGARNIISGNATIDVFLHTSTGILVEGNYIGTDVMGTIALGTTSIDVELFGASNNSVGGDSAGAGNLISGSSSEGILLRPSFLGVPSTGNTIAGNKIGTNASGKAPLANGAGVVIQGGSNNTVGGTTAGAGNLISGNVGDSIALQIDPFGNGATGVLVQGNKIGTNVTGIAALRNGGNGITVNGSNNTIGGSAANAGNIIAFNGGAGVFVNSGVGNLISRNSIFNNAALGIDLNEANNANNSQAAPVLTSAVSAPGTITIQGTLTSTPNTSFRIEFFSNPTCDPSGFGQGKKFLGFITIRTNSQGKARFTARFTAAVPKGQFITATATDPMNDTSEFSNCQVVTG